MNFMRFQTTNTNKVMTLKKTKLKIEKVEI